jgi:hypothetical protein
MFVQDPSDMVGVQFEQGPHTRGVRAAPTSALASGCCGQRRFQRGSAGQRVGVGSDRRNGDRRQAVQ